MSSQAEINDNEKSYKCSKYFNLKELLFMICSPLIFDEKICDDLPINILEYNI